MSGIRYRKSGRMLPAAFAALFLLSSSAIAAPDGLKVAEVFGLPDGVSDAAGLLARGLPAGNTAFGIAPALGNLTSSNLHELDETLIVVISKTVLKIAALEDKSWENVLQACQENVFLQQQGEPIHRVKTLQKKRTSLFNFNGSPNANIIKEVKHWFENILIKDQDVIDTAQIDLEKVSILVARSGAAINSFGSFFYRKVRKEHQALDVAVLRFPDTDKPYFKLYRIELTAWRETERVLFYQVDKAGITGKFHSVVFIPSDVALSQMTQQARQAAVEEAEQLLI